MTANEKAPCCGASGTARELWPSYEVQQFLEIAGTQNLKDSGAKGQRISIVFLHSALDFLLEDILWKLLEAHTKSWDLKESIIDNTWKVKDRIKLFDKLSDKPLKSILESNNVSTFLEDWKNLSKLRNQILHRKDYFSSAKDIDLFLRVYNHCLKVFSLIHNYMQGIVRKSNGK